jgi:hypothetical protein
MRQSFRAIFVFVMVFNVIFASSCSLFSSGSQEISIQPTSPRAEVFVDGAHVGTGTMTYSMKKKKTHSVMARCGDSTGVAIVDRQISTTGVLDLVGGFLILIPFLGVFGPGFYELDPEHVVVSIPDVTACKTPAQQDIERALERTRPLM